MNNIKVTVELCAEDRARLDKIADLLEARAIQVQADLENKLDKPADDINEMLKKAIDPAKAPKNAQEEPKATDHPTLDPFPEAPTAKEEPGGEPVKETKPAVTMDMLRSKAITLAAAGKKDQVRDVVHPYASKVTELPENVWAEVYEKLSKLEG
jgi:hypothetical protein